MIKNYWLTRIELKEMKKVYDAIIKEMDEKIEEYIDSIFLDTTTPEYDDTAAPWFAPVGIARGNAIRFSPENIVHVRVGDITPSATPSQADRSR